jgi:hypothetical protein
MMAVLVEAGLRSLILALVAGLGLRLFRVRNAQIEMTVWITVLAASLAMPVLMQWPVLRLHLPTAPAPLPYLAPAPVSFAGTPPTAIPVPIKAVFQPDLSWLPGLIYGTVAGALLLRLLAGLAVTARIVRRALPIRADWTEGVTVRVTPAVTAPVTFGRVVLLPIASMDWPAAKRRAVLAHERAHIEHRDFLVQLLSQLHSALFWFNPMAWWLRIRLAWLAERTSDEAAIGQLGSRVGYAEILLDIATGARTVPAGIAMARPALLRRRVESILSRTAPAIGLAPQRRALLALCLLPGVLMIGGTAWRARAADIDPPAVTAPEAPPPVPEAPSSPSPPPVPDRIDETRDRSFVLLSDGNTTTGGGDRARRRLMQASRRIMGDVILFLDKDTVYAISDPALVGEAAALFRAQADLGRQQGELGRQQGELGREQGEFGRQQGEFGREIGALARRHAKKIVKHALAAAAAHIDDDDDGDTADADVGDAGTDQDFERAMAELQRKMAPLSHEQESLGAKQKELGAQQEKLGREQARLAHEAETKMQALIERALNSGAATPAP